jgi:hypothetical protein
MRGLTWSRAGVGELVRGGASIVSPGELKRRGGVDGRGWRSRPDRPGSKYDPASNMMRGWFGKRLAPCRDGWPCSAPAGLPSFLRVRKGLSSFLISPRGSRSSTSQGSIPLHQSRIRQVRKSRKILSLSGSRGTANVCGVVVTARTGERSSALKRRRSPWRSPGVVKRPRVVAASSPGSRPSAVTRERLRSSLFRITSKTLEKQCDVDAWSTPRLRLVGPAPPISFLLGAKRYQFSLSRP